MLDFLVVGAYDQSCVRSGVRYRQLDRLDKSPTFIRYPANWQGKVRLPQRGLILTKSHEPRSRTNASGRSSKTFYAFTSFHTRQKIPFLASANGPKRATR